MLRLSPQPEDAGERLDKFLAGRLPDLSRARVQALIEEGAVAVNSRTVRPSHKVAPSDDITLELPDPEPVALVPEAIPLRVVHEDADVLVLDKPAGLVVHPAPGHRSGTLVNALLAHVPGLAGTRGVDDDHAARDLTGAQMRPGIVHRLDKDTSGLMVIAKHDRAHRMLAAQLKERRMDKRYLALVDGQPRSESGTIEAPIGRDPRRPRQMAALAGGRPAVTHFRVVQRYARHTLLECKPVTGRTHQIRVHLASIGLPVAGDRTYGRKQPSVALERHFLHAARLTFRLPDGTERTFDAPLPPELAAVLKQIA